MYLQVQLHAVTLGPLSLQNHCPSSHPCQMLINSKGEVILRRGKAKRASPALAWLCTACVTTGGTTCAHHSSRDQPPLPGASVDHCSAGTTCWGPSPLSMVFFWEGRRRSRPDGSRTSCRPWLAPTICFGCIYGEQSENDV